MTQAESTPPAKRPRGSGAGRLRPKQLSLSFRAWGGARRGAGRRPNGPRPGVPHLARPTLSRHHPVHVTLRVRPGIPSLRRAALYSVVRGAFAQGRERFGFRLVHYSVQSNHLHLIVEASDRRSLARGVQGLSIRIARALNGRLGRRGPAFADRYHARALTTPRAARAALSYVLLNAGKHAGARALPAGFVNPCSSAAWFAGWNRPRSLVFGSEAAASHGAGRTQLPPPPIPVVAARTWLLRVGYRRAGPVDPELAPPSTSTPARART